MKKLFLAGAMLLAIAVAQPAAAQTVITYNWGGVHMMSDQVVSINLRVDKAAVPVTFPVLLTLEDKLGNILYTRTVNVTNGRTYNWSAGWNAQVGGGAFDHFMDSDFQAVQISQDVHVLVATLKAFVPGNGVPYLDLMTPTFEIVNMGQTYNVTSFLNNPHVTLAAWNR
jgi:hypothetical protein